MKRLKYLIPILLLIASLGFSAELLRYVDPDAVGGGTGLDWTNAYTSLNAWEAAEQQDLTDGGGDWMHAYVRASGGTADTIATTIVGWTTGAATYILVEAASGDEAVITGYDETRYRLEVTDATCLGVSEDYVRLVGLQIKQVYVGTGANGISFGIGASSDNLRVIAYCRISSSSNVNTVRAMISTDATNNFEIYNTIFDTWGNDILNMDADVGVIYNSTFYNSGVAGIEIDSGTWLLKNNIVAATADDFQIDAGSVTIDYNASDDEDGTNSQKLVATNNYAAEFVDAPNRDFTLVSGSVADDNGTDDPGSGLYSDDIAGTTRVSPWDMGAYELIAAAGGIVIFRRRIMGYIVFGLGIEIALFLMLFYYRPRRVR